MDDIPSLSVPLSPSFVAWCDERGIKRIGIDAAYVKSGWRGIVATENIKSGQVILSCPEKCLISNRLAKQSQSFLASQGHLKPNESLAVILLHELSKANLSDPHNQSAWEPYLRSLPQGYTCLCRLLCIDYTTLQTSVTMHRLHYITYCALSSSSSPSLTA